MFYLQISQSPTSAFLRHQPKDIAPCGEVCSYGGTIDRNSEKVCPWPQIRKHFNCENIMKRMAYRNHKIIDPPPSHPPDDLLDDFTMFGEMPITQLHYHYENWTAKTKHFSAGLIDGIMQKLGRGENVNMYKDGICVQHTLQRHVQFIKGKRGFVVGTDLPWLEGMLLGFGARQVTTLEYAELVFDSPEIEAYTPYDFADKWLKGEIEPYDFGVTFSSIEHSGLGRYTDPLNPYGDLESMAQSWCMVKRGGMFAVGVEDSLNASSYILWNAHRVYGPKRLAQLTANWEVLEKALCADIFNHNFVVLRKPLE